MIALLFLVLNKTIDKIAMNYFVCNFNKNTHHKQIDSQIFIIRMDIMEIDEKQYRDLSDLITH